MCIFKALLGESKDGNFTFETKDKFFDIEINVNYSTQTILVCYYRGTGFEPVKKETFHSLYGSYGFSGVEEKFNEILKSLTNTLNS